MLAHQLGISPNWGRCCYTVVKQLTQLSFPKCIVLIHDFIQITSFSWNTTGERDDGREIGEDVGRGMGKESNIGGTAGTTGATCGLGQCPIPPCSVGVWVD